MAQYLLSSSCKSETLVVNNNTPLGAIFNDANVGKKLSAAYWDLVEYGDKEDGPLADLIMTCGFPRGFIAGTIKKIIMAKREHIIVAVMQRAANANGPKYFSFNGVSLYKLKETFGGKK